ncbi:MAG: FAD-dependent oxidoreductase [Clostridioides sp.]|jgi:thioredoxin reductase (NADPH)|nr:FAD-dependent oxidoreductase [Clostridioides sp.]
MKDLIVIGAGPAGLTAGLYAVRAGLDVSVYEKNVYGGQVTSTPEVENYPSVQKVSGFEFANNIYTQTVSQGVKMEFDEVLGIEDRGDHKIVKTSSGDVETRTVIIANGVERRKLGVKGEQEFTMKGVTYCATCDGAFFKGQDVAIVGGGNTALEDALDLSNTSSKVYLIHRGDHFTGQKVLQDAVIARENIEIISNSVVEEIAGDTNVKEIIVKSQIDGSTKSINVKGVFVAIGLIPNNGMFGDVIDLDKHGYIISDDSCKTNVEGVYVAGDCRTKFLRQIITAASDGAVASVQAVNYVNQNVVQY